MHGATTIPRAEFGGKRMSEGTCRRRFGKVKTLLQAERQVASSRTSGSVEPDSGHFLLDLPFFFGVEPDISLILLEPFFLLYCHRASAAIFRLRASAAAGSSQNSRRATLTAAPGYARRWCTIETHHLQRKHLVTPRREQPRRVLRGCDSPTGIPFQIRSASFPKA